MDIASEQEILDNISRGRCFSAQLDSGAFCIKIDRYQPLVATAVHDGHRVVQPFFDKMQLSANERLFEEDPFTGAIAEFFPIALRGVDSRYCYDLNRSPEACIYDVAWGKQVWKKPLGRAGQEQLRFSHGTYYRVLQALLGSLESRFGRFVLYDLHSYNYGRIGGSAPLFNIGTHFIDRDEYQPVLDNLLAELQRVRLPGLATRAVCDEVFSGQGYQAEFIRNNFFGSLCLPLEIKKVFMDEQAAELQADLFERLLAQLHRALTNNAEFFADYCGLKLKGRVG